MKIFAISDIHVDGKNKVIAYSLPQKMLHHFASTKEKSVLIILGDVSQNLPILHNFLKLFQNIPIPKLFVAGNHDIWTPRGTNSLAKYLVVVKEAVEDAGFHYLDKEPFIIDRIGFIGNMGWYDYSFRVAQTTIPSDIKLIRCASAQYINWEELSIEDYKEKMLMGESNGNLFVVTSWNDRLNIHWDFTDIEFSMKCLKKIKQNFSEIDHKVDQIVFASHHVHFQEGVIFKNKVSWDFNNAFVGSRLIGEFVLTQKKVNLLLFAHTHVRDSLLVNNSIRSYNPAFQNANQDFTVIDYP
jgi:hypothetical protein